MHGTVKRFSDSQGYGFLRGEDHNDYFCHHSNINMNGFRTLMTGEAVIFDIEHLPDGRTRAVNVSLAPTGKEA